MSKRLVNFQEQKNVSLMKRIQCGDIEIATVDAGVGVPVLLVHGFPLDHTMWDPAIAALQQHCRVIAPDLRGYGATPLGEIDEAAGVTMPEYAADLLRLLDGLGIEEPVVLVGFSMGGYIAWPFWEAAPERLCGLVLCDTRAAADDPEAKRMRLKMADKAAEWGTRKIADAMEAKLFAKATREDRPEIIAETREVIGRTAPEAIAAAQRGMAERPDWTPRLGEMNLPTLAIVGDQDVISPPAEMQAITAAMPNARTEVIPGAGHMTTVEQPEAVIAAILRFVKELES